MKRKNENTYNGIVLGMLDSQVLLQPIDSSLSNRNTFVAGGPGSYKTQAFVLTNVLTETCCSILCTDPKGEVYEKTALIKKQQGYDVFVVNFKDMRFTCHWNPFDYVRRDNDAGKVANTIVASRNDPKNKDIWYLSQASLLKALILLATYEFPVEKRNISGVLDFLQDHNPEADETGIAELDMEFLNLDRKHPARRAYELGFAKSKAEARASIIISLLTTLGDFVDAEVESFTSNSDFMLSELGERKIIVYVLIDVIDKTWEGLINLFFSQCFQELYVLGNKNHAKLPNPLIILLDELPSLGRFENLEEFLATCRGYGIACCPIVQHLTQLYDKYGKDRAESIIGDCCIKLCMGGVNETTAKYFYNQMGNSTVKVETGGSSVSKGKNNGSSSKSDSYNYIGRPLMTADEIMGMDPDTLLCLMISQHPIKLQKAKQFKLYPGLTDKYETGQELYKREMSQKAIEHLTQLKNRTAS